MSELTGVTSPVDGFVAVYEPNAPWKTWALHEIYTGGIAQGRYVPKVKDHVVDVETNEKEIVISLDAITMVPRLRKLKNAVIDTDISYDDLLMGVGPGTNSDTYRVYIDKSVLPHTLSVDARLFVRGSMCKYATIIKGSELLNDRKVISAFYDNVGNLLGQNIELELASTDGNNLSKTVKTVPTCYTTEDLEDDEVVTVVFYSDTGGVVSKRQLLVENTAFMRMPDASQKYITHISLDTPFLSDSDPKLINYPVNVPINGFNLFGIVHYSDGSQRRMPVDGTKFSLFGLQNYVATVVEQRLPLVLKYTLSPGEYVYGATVAADRFITETYQAVTTSADGAYSVMLQCYPVYIDELNGYRLEWFMTNLDRKLMYKVTPYVSIGDNSPPLRSTAYGALQKLAVTIDLNDVNGTYKKYTHTQTVEIILQRPGTDHTGTNWSIGFEPGQNPQFGKNNNAFMTFVNQNLKRVKIDQGEETLSAWLDRMFYLTKPLFDSDREIEAPEPNMFSIILENKEVAFNIDNWRSELPLETLMKDGDTLFIKFFKRTVETDLILGVSALPVYQIG